MIEGLIELVVSIWRGDTEMRENSLVGQSELDRKSSRMVAWICGGLISLLGGAWIAWAWLVDG